MTTFSQTDCDDSWWMVDLNEVVQIQRISISNRWCVDSADPTGCLCRLSNATLLILDENDTAIASEVLSTTCGVLQIDIDLFSNDHCTATGSPTLSPSLLSTVQPTSSCTAARYVKLLQNAINEPFELFEVEIYSSGVNVVFGKIAKQSSIYLTNRTLPRFARYAIDGDRTTFSRTECNELWWIVDLGSMMPIENIRIVNHSCEDQRDQLSCLCRLSFVRLSFVSFLLLNEQESIVGAEMIGDTCEQHECTYNFCTQAPCSSTAKPIVSPNT